MARPVESKTVTSSLECRPAAVPSRTSPSWKQPALLVIDAQTEVLADAGLNENSGTDVGKWMSWYLTPAMKLGVTTVFLDHVGHDEAKRSRGSGHKGNAAKVELAVKVVKDFDRNAVGVIQVTQMKNTLAAPIPKDQWFRIGGTPFVLEPCDEPLSVAPDHAGNGGESKGRAYFRIKQDLVTALQKHGQDGLSVAQLRGMVDGNKRGDRQGAEVARVGRVRCGGVEARPLGI
jgi:hypothetical protein